MDSIHPQSGYAQESTETNEIKKVKFHKVLGFLGDFFKVENSTLCGEFQKGEAFK